jgi:uncharacterized protein YndB with AHSA1/START domain
MTAFARKMTLALLASTSLFPVSGQQAVAAEPLVAEAIINAPLATVWQAFATPDGYASVNVPHAAVDLRMGGLLQVQPDPKGTLGDKGTTVSEIIAFEPERLLTLRVRQAPAGSAEPQAFANTWTIVYFAPLGAEMTHVRVAGFGFNEGPAAATLAKFFEQDQVAQMRRLEKHYWPLCALCKPDAK